MHDEIRDLAEVCNVFGNGVSVKHDIFEVKKCELPPNLIKDDVILALECSGSVLKSE